MKTAPGESSHHVFIESPHRALDRGFGLCSITWGAFWGCAYAPDADRLLAPTSGVGTAPTTSARINVYKPDSTNGGIAKLARADGTNPNGAPVYVPTADKFFFGVNSFVPDANLDTLTRAGDIATATTFDPHGLATGDSVPISNADQPEYNGTHVITVTGANTFTFEVADEPATPATPPGEIKWKAVDDSAFAVVDPNTLAIEYVGGFELGIVKGSRSIYISSKDRVWLLLQNSSGQIAEINPADNTFTIINDPALSAMTDFVYCPDDDHVYANCFNQIKKIDAASLAVTEVYPTPTVAGITFAALTWVPDNGTDAASGKVWVGMRDATGSPINYILFIAPITNVLTSFAVPFFFSVLTFIPTIERVTAYGSDTLPATFFISYKADLTQKNVLSRILTGNGCYCDEVNKAALVVIKDNRWCVEYYTQEELSP